MSGLEKIAENKEKIMAVAMKHGAENLRVFGSVARNEDHPQSDVDFLVTMRSGCDLLDMVALEQELEGVLHRKTDVISEDEVSPYLRARIFKEAVAV